MASAFRLRTALAPAAIAALAVLPQTAAAQRPEPAWRAERFRAEVRSAVPPRPEPSRALAGHRTPWLAQPGPWGARLPAPLFGRRGTGPAALADSGVIRPTYWLEGGLIGGIPMGVFGALLATGLCGYDDGPCEDPVLQGILGFGMGALVGFGPGALIGGQFPKHPSAEKRTPAN